MRGARTGGRSAGAWLTATGLAAALACSPAEFASTQLQDGGGDALVEGGADDGHAASDGGGDAAPLGPVDACASGLRGPSLVLFDGFCIDATEVTVAQYGEFVAAVTQAPASAKRGPGCAWKQSFAEGASAPDRGDCVASTVDPLATDLPVRCVDWCDAFAYCAWAGKRLCGGRQGGSVPVDAGASAATSEWFAACSSEGRSVFAFGSTCDASAPPCRWRESDGGEGPLAPAGSTATCVGSVPDLFDLNGSVWEWEDSCDTTTTAAPVCRSRGGSFLDTDPCKAGCSAYVSDEIDKRWRDVGFRCCWP